MTVATEDNDNSAEQLFQRRAREWRTPALANMPGVPRAGRRHVPTARPATTGAGPHTTTTADEGSRNSTLSLD
ncbi:hypothetical protein GCM10010182_07390 [Actinomadura cremea]|nr:hypothetical protein GCM10010182_07390 [Actinomadura cremea]